MKKVLLVIVATLLLTGCGGAEERGTPTLIPTFDASMVAAPITFGQVKFSFQGDTPLVSRSPSTEIENDYINPGAVLFHAGRFHMFFNSFTDWPGVIQVGYMSSPDGRNWTLEESGPVFTTNQIPFGEGKADISSVFVKDDGIWVMVFHTVGQGAIGLATADDPKGPWSVMADPVLMAGSEGTWDEDELGWPSIVRYGDQYFMFYGGKGRGRFSIGLAFSKDGLSWEKYNDPTTDDELFRDSDPVLIAEEDWESFKVDRPRVTLTPEGMVMIYQAGLKISSRGLAISRDGIRWTKYGQNPVFTSEDFPIPSAQSWDTALFFHNDIYYYIMEIGTLAGTDLYLAVHEGALTE